MMGNLFDYLQWRGDLTFKQSGFNPVDNLILSVLAYVPFDTIVPQAVDDGALTISTAAERFFKLDQTALPIRMKEDVQLLSATAASERFGSLRLSGYVNKIDTAAEEQFSAITVDTGDDHTFIAYRGTDLTLVGWKEDLNMTFLSAVPSQLEAVKYLETVGGRIRGKLRLGGHSKGGNLAVYAAAFVGEALQERIVGVYNNDGPGFHSSVIERDGYRNVQDRLFAFMPQSSIVGLLLKHNERYTIIESAQTGLLQHDAYSWRVMGPDFVRAVAVADSTLFIDRTLKDWFNGIQPAQRERFIDALYSIILATGALSLSDLTNDWLKNAVSLSRSLKNIDAPTKKLLRETLGKLLEATKKNLAKKWP